MVKKAETPRSSIRLPIPMRDMANAKARARGMQTLQWLSELIEKEPSDITKVDDAHV
jgi:hypothetical protein